MEALIGEHGSRESLYESIYDYFDISLIKQDDRVYYSKLAILSNPNVLFNIAEDLSRLIIPSLSHLCVLASSGMAIGVALSLYSRLPIIFYRRLQWPKPESEGLGPKFLPSVPLDSNVGMVDSHERTRYTSAVCFDELYEEYGITVSQMIAPISFDMCIDQNYNRNMTYSYLKNASEIVNTISNRNNLKLSKDKLVSYFDQTNFWLYPPLEIESDPYKEFRAPGLAKSPSWFIGSGSDISIFEKIENEFSLSSYSFKSKDDEIWNFFLYPSLVEEFSKEAGEKLDIKKYDYLIGVGHLGTALSIALAYYNQNIFSGSIIMYLGGHGLVPNPDSLFGKKVLPIEMRITTGVYAVDIYTLVKKYNGLINKYLTVFLPPVSKRIISLNDIAMKSRQTSLRKMKEHGVEFLYFFD